MTPAQIPTFAQERFAAAAAVGSVQAIQTRPARQKPPVGASSWVLSRDGGGNLDHATSTKRAVTLFQFEDLAAIGSYLGRQVTFEQTRRNVCVRGFNLEIARSRHLRLGDVILEITGRCHPCIRMDETMGPGGFTAMFGHGGWTASIVTGGEIRVGDPVELVEVGEDFS